MWSPYPRPGPLQGAAAAAAAAGAPPATPAAPAPMAVEAGAATKEGGSAAVSAELERALAWLRLKVAEKFKPTPRPQFRSKGERNVITHWMVSWPYTSPLVVKIAWGRAYAQFIPSSEEGPAPAAAAGGRAPGIRKGWDGVDEGAWVQVDAGDARELFQRALARRMDAENSAGRRA